ncbi:hypothetical protein KY084_00385 [Stakelama sp. CBK3Z-3]|uniref:DUF2933 domain-containing protein n=1 Tax=Stakelama flava TaxID=2860338 RepID=A0ABS6XGK2_9SPHN|nr:hypothetical protein [Stakelama flava]MBW4329335.1 hypothetical protein [Stakelama flava]
MKPVDRSSLAEITKSLRTSSAVVPALILTGICLPICAAAAAFVPPPGNYFFLGLALLCPLATLLQIVFFTFVDRDRLQNESHVERKMMLAQMRPEIGDSSAVLEAEANDRLIANPSAEEDGDA